MFSYNVLKICTYFVVFSVGYLIGEIVLKKYGKMRDKKIITYMRGTLLLLSSAMMIWLLFNKERFHWNYDIATGEPVDHYSTYWRCIAYVIVAVISNAIGMLTRVKRDI